MRKSGLICAVGTCLLILGTSLSDAQDLQTFAAGAPSVRDYPDTDGVVLHEEIAWTLHPDGRIDRYTRHIRKYLTPHEVDEYSDPRITFDSATQTLEILSWQTAVASGRLVEKKDRAFNQVTPDAVGRAPDYATIQEMVSSHLGMEEGAVVEREYVIRDRADRGEGLSGIEFFGSRLPVVEKIIRITVPSGTDLRFEAVGDAPSYERDEHGAMVTHVWRVENIPGVSARSVEGSERDCLSWLVFSTLGSWEELAEIWNGRIRSCAGLTDRLRDELEEIVEDAQDDTEKTRLVHDAVCSSVRTIHYAFPLLGTRCRPAGVVYGTGYGHRLDKAVLLLAWLGAAGIDAEPVLVSSSLRFSKKVVAIQQVPHLWVVAWTDHRPIWMDPCQSLAAASYRDLAGRAFVRVASGGGLDTVPEGGVGENVSALKITGKVSEDGCMEGQVRLRLTGIFSPYHGVSGAGDEAKDFVEQLASGIFGGVEVETYNFRELTDEVVAVGFGFRKEAGEDGISRLVLPGTAEPIEIAGFEGVAEERRTALLLPGSFSVRVEVNLELWEGAKIQKLPQPFDLEAPFGSCSVRCEESEGFIRFFKQMEMSRRRIEPDEYPQFRTMVLQDRNEARRTVVLATD